MEWPTILPNPLSSGYKYKGKPIVVRTQMEGKTRARKRFTKQPYSFSFQIRCNDTQLAVFEYFWEKIIASGAKWFNMPLASGKGLEEIQARFLTEPDINADGRYWLISGSVEVEELNLYSEGEYNNAIGVI